MKGDCKMENKETVRKYFDVDPELWRQVSIESAKLGIYKKDFVTRALENEIKRLREKEKLEECRS